MIGLNKNNYFLLEEIVKRNFSAKYKDTVLGILWTVMKPLLIMILLTIIFSTIFSRNIDNFPVYFLSGKCIYDFFNASTNVALISIKSNKNILKSTAAPKHIFVLGGIISEFLNFIITIIILIGVMIVTKAPFYFGIMPLSVIPITSLLLTVTGLGLILSVLCIYYTDTQHIWNIATLMFMYASGIFYPIDIIPEPYHQYLIMNPIYWIIDQFRCFFIWGKIPTILYIANSLLLSGMLIILGIIIFKKYENKISMKF